MRRLTLLVAGGALWLFLAAIPALADGGPHVSSENSGSSNVLTADSCAGCHRAHTAQGEMLLAAADEEALCLTCHGTTGTGASTDVKSGIQYESPLTADAGTGVRTGPVLGALRAGGFVTARIDSGNMGRRSYDRGGGNVSFLPKVPVLLTGEPVTSAHLDLDGTGGVTARGVVWGNGAFSATANPGGPFDLNCGSCHNPHGNGNYRILNAIPAHGAGPGFVSGAAAVNVSDGPAVPAGDTRNYTVIQTDGTNRLLLASQAASFSETSGDYFGRKVPWTSTAGSALDGPNGQPATFNTQMTQWCSQCHSRYMADGFTPAAAPGDPYDTDSGDAIFKYRHPTRSNRVCSTCHVAHGSNADMSGRNSSAFPYPNDPATTADDAAAVSASSRLLKVDNRGTCQACHDPTETITIGTYNGPLPEPGVP